MVLSQTLAKHFFVLISLSYTQKCVTMFASDRDASYVNTVISQTVVCINCNLTYQSRVTIAGQSRDIKLARQLLVKVTPSILRGG